MSNFKKYAPKVISAALSLTILCSGISVASYSAGAKDNGGTSAASATNTSTSKTSSSKSNSKKLSKNETVYVIADAKGSAKKVIVSDWIKNTAKADSINDVSNLKSIENLKGDEKYEMNSDNMCVWDANGNDIYYQGTSKEDLPVDLTVSYKLDGKAISPSELAGKNGKVTMRFDYNNKQYENVKIDGKEQKIYVPFVMLTGMILDNEKFSDIKVSNGKIINDGEHSYVAGFACPGMQENLDIDKDKVDIPDYVEITADAKNFELSTTLTLASNDVFSDADFSKVDEKVNKLSDSLDDMMSATNKLIDGSSTLYNGLKTLLNKSDTLVKGVQTLTENAQKLKDGAGTLDSGAGQVNNGAQSVDSGVAELQGYIATLSNGLGDISSNSSTLNAAAKQVFDTLLATADTQIAAAGVKADKLTINNYSKVLSGVQSSISEDKVYKLAYNAALQTVTTTVKEQKDLITQKVTAAVKSQVFAGVLAKAGLSMTEEEYEAAVLAGKIPAETQQQISAAVEAQMSSEGIQATISAKTEEEIQSLIDENMKSDKVQALISQAVSKAKEGAKAIGQLKTQLDSYNQFYQGVLAYTNGVDTANAGAQQILSGTSTLKNGTSTLKNGTSTLKNGTSTLKNGTGQFSNGMNTLKNGSSALIGGVTQLKNGSMTLTNGLKQFKKDGVSVLVKAVNGDVKGLVNRLKAISKVSSNYKSYSGISDDMDGKVDFVYKTDSIEK